MIALSGALKWSALTVIFSPAAGGLNPAVSHTEVHLWVEHRADLERNPVKSARKLNVLPVAFSPLKGTDKPVNKG